MPYYDAQGNVTTDLSKAVTSVIDNPGTEGDVSSSLVGDKSFSFVGGSNDPNPDLVYRTGSSYNYIDKYLVDTVLGDLGLSRDQIGRGSIDSLQGLTNAGDIKDPNDTRYTFDASRGNIAYDKNFFTGGGISGVQNLSTGANAVGATNIGSTASALNPNSPENIAARQAAATRLGVSNDPGQPATQTQPLFNPTTGQWTLNGQPTQAPGTVQQPQADFQAAAGTQQPTAGAANPFFGIPANISGQFTSAEQASKYQQLVQSGMTPQQALQQTLGQTNGSTGQLGGQTSSLGGTNQKADDATVNALYNKYFGRNASPAELANWGSKGGADTTVSALDNFLKQEQSKYAVTDGGVPTVGNNPVSNFQKTYKSLLTDLGISDIKASFEKSQKDYTDLQNELNDKIVEINDNPWLTEGIRLRQIEKEKGRYEGRLAILQNSMKLTDALYQQGLSEAKFLATGIQDDQQLAAKQAQDAADALAKLKELDTDFVEFNGRKYLVSYDSQGNVKNKLDLGASSSVRSGSGTAKITSGQRSILQRNFSASEIDQISKDIAEYGLSVTLDGINDFSQRQVIQEAFGIKQTEPIKDLDIQLKNMGWPEKAIRQFKQDQIESFSSLDPNVWKSQNSELFQEAISGGISNPF